MSGIALLIGSIIGSGIFISPRGVLLGTGKLPSMFSLISNIKMYSYYFALGSYGLSILVWIICGLVCVPGCLCYAELGTMIHSSGGDYTYIKMAFGDWAGKKYLLQFIIVIFH
jgi:amino acid transporter